MIYALFGHQFYCVQRSELSLKIYFPELMDQSTERDFPGENSSSSVCSQQLLKTSPIKKISARRKLLIKAIKHSAHYKWAQPMAH